MVFETAEDFELIGTCCKIAMDKEASEKSKENVPAIKVNEEGQEGKEMTPLSQMNLRWRRKSREFGKVIEEGQGKATTRPTSTPLQASFESPSTMQISSINYNSNSSESQLSPPVVEVPQPTQKPVMKPPLISPMEKKKTRTTNTPLRQIVMTKSIHRANAHEQQQKKYVIQQRRMTFDSTSSSNEKTISLMKLDVDAFEEPPEKQMDTNNNDSNQAIDLRLSPALRRDIGHAKFQAIPKVQFPLAIKEEPQENPTVKEEVVAGSSENTTILSFKSCGNDTIATPKVTASSGNLLKKTISFEPPRTIEKTPVMLLVKNPRKTSDSDDEDVFYTPQATPARRRYSMESDIFAFEPLHIPLEGSQSPPKKKKSWNLISKVMDFAKGRISPNLDASPPGTSKASNFGMAALRRAADYLSNLPGKIVKRRRHSSGSANSSSESFNTTRDSKSLSPQSKKRRIQGRKPIDRMLNN